MIHDNIKKITSRILPCILLSQTITPSLAMEQNWERLKPENPKDLGLFMQKTVDEELKKKYPDISKLCLSIELLNDNDKIRTKIQKDIQEKADKGDPSCQYVYGWTGLWEARYEKIDIRQSFIQNSICYLNKSASQGTPIACYHLGMICLGNLFYAYNPDLPLSPVIIPPQMSGFPETEDELKLKGFELLQQAKQKNFQEAIEYFNAPYGLVITISPVGSLLKKKAEKREESIAQDNLAIARAKEMVRVRAELEKARLEEAKKDQKVKAQKTELATKYINVVKVDKNSPERTMTKKERIKKHEEEGLLHKTLDKEVDMKKRALMMEEVRIKADRGDSHSQYLYGVTLISGDLEETEILKEDTIRKGLTYLNKSINSGHPIAHGLFYMGMICLGNLSYNKTLITIPLGMPGFPNTSDELKLKGFELIRQAADWKDSNSANYLQTPYRQAFYRGKQGETLYDKIIKKPEAIAEEEQAIARARVRAKSEAEAKAREAEKALLEKLDNEEKVKTQKAEAQKRKQQELKKKAEQAKKNKAKEDTAAQKKKEDLENAKALKAQQEEAKRIKEEALRAKQELEAQKKAQREAQKEEDKRKREEAHRIKEEEAKREKEQKRQARLAEEERNRAEKAAKKQENIAAQERLRVAAQLKREQQAQKALEEKNREEKAEQQKNNESVQTILMNPNPVREQTIIPPTQEIRVRNELHRQLAIKIVDDKQSSNEKQTEKKKSKMHWVPKKLQELDSLKNDVKHGLEVGKIVCKPIFGPIQCQPIFGPTMSQAINILNVRQAADILSANYEPGTIIPSHTDHVWEEGTDEQGNPVLAKKRHISYLFNGSVKQTIVPLNGPEIIDPLIKLPQEVSDDQNLPAPDVSLKN